MNVQPAAGAAYVRHPDDRVPADGVELSDATDDKRGEEVWSPHLLGRYRLGLQFGLGASLVVRLSRRDLYWNFKRLRHEQPERFTDLHGSPVFPCVSAEVAEGLWFEGTWPEGLAVSAERKFSTERVRFFVVSYRASL